jgi:hypothetical protein
MLENIIAIMIGIYSAITIHQFLVFGLLRLSIDSMFDYELFDRSNKHLRIGLTMAVVPIAMGAIVALAVFVN